MFEIEKGIPVPKRSGVTGPRGSKYPFSAMESGDSFFVKVTKNASSTRSSLRASFRRWVKATGSDAALRTAAENDGVRAFML